MLCHHSVEPPVVRGAATTPFCPLTKSHSFQQPLSNLGPPGLSSVGTLGEGVMPSECPGLPARGHRSSPGLWPLHSQAAGIKTPKTGAQQLWKCQERWGGSRHSPELPAGMGRSPGWHKLQGEKAKKKSPVWGYLAAPKISHGWGCLGWVWGYRGAGVFIGGCPGHMGQENDEHQRGDPSWARSCTCNWS